MYISLCVQELQLGLRDETKASVDHEAAHVGLW